MKILTILATTVLTCISCTTATCERDTIKELRPLTYRHIAKEDLACLTNKINFDIKYNDFICTKRIDTLTNTIKAHNAKK